MHPTTSSRTHLPVPTPKNKQYSNQQPHSYGTLLGSSIFQSFIGGVVAFKCLPRAQFATLQTAIFPIYFALQSACPIILALTYPGPSTRNSLLGGSSSPSGYRGVLAPENRWSVAAPISAILAANLINLVWAGPKTNEIMRLRKHQGMYSCYVCQFGSAGTDWGWLQKLETARKLMMHHLIRRKCRSSTSNSQGCMGCQRA